MLTLTGRDPARNVFAITTAQLQSAGQVTIDVTAGSTTLINVTGSSFTSGLYRIELVGGSPDKLLWNFPMATAGAADQRPGLAGNAARTQRPGTVSNGNLYGQIIADRATIGSYGLFHRPSPAACRRRRRRTSRWRPCAPTR